MLRPPSLLLATLISVVASSSSSELDAFTVPSFDYTSLAASSASLLDALQHDGILSLHNIPQYALLRSVYLREATTCALAAGAAGDSFLQYKTLQDGTQRYTISATAGASASDDTRVRCPAYAASYRALSELAETAVAALGKTLDVTPFRVTSHEQLRGSALLAESVHLDHFHAYEASPARESQDGALLSLELHTDNGMLIAMTAPQYFDVSHSGSIQDKPLAAYESGLLIENRAGKLVKPTLKEDELVVMVGSGFQEWIRASPALRPVPHAMKYPSLAVATEPGARVMRAWFGKMVLLSPAQRMLNVNMTFGEYAAQTTRFLLDHTDGHDSTFAALACPHGRRLHESDGKCVVRQCVPKTGKDPELACAVQCNLSEKARPGAARICEDNCVCQDKPGNGTAQYCWMLCVSDPPAGACGAGVVPRCKTGKEAPYIVDQAVVCNATTTTTTTAKTTTAESVGTTPTAAAVTVPSAAVVVHPVSLTALATVSLVAAVML